MLQIHSNKESPGNLTYGIPQIHVQDLQPYSNCNFRSITGRVGCGGCMERQTSAVSCGDGITVWQSKPVTSCFLVIVNAWSLARRCTYNKRKKCK